MSEWDYKYSTTPQELEARLGAIHRGALGSNTLAEVLKYKKESARVLEIGCGTGQHSVALKLARPAWDIVATDSSDGAVREAHALADLADAPITVQVTDVTALPFPDATFDIVFGDHVVGHIADLHTALHECARVLKPGGMVAFNAANTLRPDGWPLYHALAHKPYAARSFFPWSLRSHLQHAGLRPQRSYGSLLYLPRSLALALGKRSGGTKSAQRTMAPQAPSTRSKVRMLVESLIPSFLKVEYGIVASK